jgi:hypothetical protein
LATGVEATRRLAPGTTFSFTNIDDPTHPDNATGTVFRGWYTGTYTPGTTTLYDRIEINSIPVGTTDITLTALWVQGVEITLALGGGAFPAPPSGQEPRPTTYWVAPGTNFRMSTVGTPARDDFIYTGWFLNSAFTEPVPGDGVPVTDADLIGGVTVYAGWFEQALLTAYSNGTATYVLEYNIGSFRGGYFSTSEIRIFDWSLAAAGFDGQTATISGNTLTVGTTAYTKVTDMKTPATNANVRGNNWTKGGITLNLWDSSSNGLTQVSNAEWQNVQLSYVVEGSNLHLLRRVITTEPGPSGDSWDIVTVVHPGELVLTIPLDSDNNLTGWTKQ